VRNIDLLAREVIPAVKAYKPERRERRRAAVAG
jgi:hypothetical protein